MHTPEIGAVLARVRAYRTAANLSKSAFALKTGLSRMALMGIDDADWSPTSDTLKKIEAVIPANWREGDPLPVEQSDAAQHKAA